MEESSPPTDAEGNVFYQFDVQVTGELVPGGASTVDGYFCLLPSCREEKSVFTTRRALIKHRLQTHSLPRTGTYKIPEADQIRQWLRCGKPRPYEIPPGPSLLSKLLHCKPDYTESELQPASLESNIYEQFNVRLEPGEAGGPPYVGFVCLLSQCHEEKVCFNTYPKWTRHRRSVHQETVEAQSVTLPDGYEIREWVILNKPRPYNVLVKRKAWKKEKLCPVDPAVFAEFDVQEDNQKLQFFCLLDPCKRQGISFQGRRRWTKHRVEHHMSPKYEDAEYILPSKEIVKDWMNAGKPHHYQPPKRVQTFVDIDPPSAKTNTELHNPEVNPTPSEVGNELHGEKSQVSEDKESRKLCGSANQHSHGHHQELHKLLSLEGRPSLRSSKSLARLGKLRTFTPPVEIPRESRRRRGRRPRNADVAGCSSDTEPAHQKKKKRHSSIHSADRSHSTDSAHSDSSDVVALRVVAPGEDPSGGLWKEFIEETNLARDETPRADDKGSDDVSENVGDLSVDQTMEDLNHDHNSADKEESGEERREDSARPEDSVSSGDAEVAEVDEDGHEEIEAPDNVLSSQPELQDVKVVGRSSTQTQDFQGMKDEHQKSSNAEMTEAGEEASEEFEAQDNVLPSQLELQNIKVVGHSSVHPQDFQGVTDEHQRNSTAEMADADEEAPKDSVASENVVPSLQNSSTEDKPDCEETGEVEDEEREDFVAPENALTALKYSQPKLWERSSVQLQDFQGDFLMETLPNSTAEMHEVEKEAPEHSVAIENVVSSLACMHPEFSVTGTVKHGNVLPQEFPREILPNTQMGEFGKAHEEFINPWNLNPSVPSNVSEQTAFSPLWHLDGNTFHCLPQDFTGENCPNSSKEDNLKHSAEMAEFGEKAPEEIVGAGNLSLSVQSGSSEQNALSTLKYYFGDALLLPPEDSTHNHRPNSNAGMAEVGEEAPEGFVAPWNVVPRIPLMQSEGTKVPSLKGPIGIQAAPIQEFVPPFSMDQVFVIGPNAPGMAEVGEEAPEGLVSLEKMEPWIPFMQSEGTKVPSLGLIDIIRAAPIQETVPHVHMDPVFFAEPNAAGMSGVGEEFAAPGNLVPVLLSNTPQETGEQLCVTSSNTNASSQDPRNIQNESIIYEHPWTSEFFHMDIATSMNEPVVVAPFAPSTQPGGREIGSTLVEGSAENSTEIEVDMTLELITLMDMEIAFESALDLPLIDDRVEENPGEFFHPEAVAHSPQPMQQLSSPGNSESSDNFPVVPVLQTDPLIDMAAGLDYELSMRL